MSGGTAVPAYTDFIKERFERCLDLYLCPRIRRKSTRSLGKSRMADDAASSDDERPRRPRAGPGASGSGADPGSDSSEDERPNRNTVGDVPLEWYAAEEHIGYDVEGKRIGKSTRVDRLQLLLDRNDSKKALRTIYDPYNDEEISLSREELAMVMRIRNGQFPHVEVRGRLARGLERKRGQGPWGAV
ncbi:Ribosome biogenesis protein BOP1 [Tetrabaena socialis]|uniref:Ribosome biogenesis protein BOP1 n=1 Tax=Tetrabaena socialis TaxID=47790 RepID=A0A2J8A5T4_9CHLO|nr:Ribosome biogenesis protein BOP1 [Tetrabaena socialis]|eukprot:PNH07892.1 Ribosome biogenesis protein BOP1 [Tetrabaena socialis]